MSQVDAAREVDAYHHLSAYTLTRGDATFIHQHVVDAWAAQHATPTGKPIALAFALVGLYLHLEKGFTGRQVQRAHMKLAQRRRAWPRFTLPSARGTMTAIDVIAARAGPARDRAVDQWCASVWGCHAENRVRVQELLAEYGMG
ncbi:MAG TPA: DUF5946 family protein [Gemmatimonadales bacterium]|nr:DUF5946 family protein [Gemmatimonadales bacterium]